MEGNEHTHFRYTAEFIIEEVNNTLRTSEIIPTAPGFSEVTWQSVILLMWHHQMASVHLKVIIWEE